MSDPTLTTLAFLGLAAFVAGWIDAVVGGGGLVQLPALLVGLPGASPAQLLATNKFGSIFGTATSSITYYRRVRPDLRTALPMAAVAYVGSIGGALIGLHIPKSAFNPIILVLLVLVGAYTILKPDLGKESIRRYDGARHTVLAMLTGFVIGVYDGALGPGTGSFLVFALVGLLGYNFLEASAKAKIANFATNLGALDGVPADGARALQGRRRHRRGQPHRRLRRRTHGRLEGERLRAGRLRRHRQRVHRQDQRQPPRLLGLTPQHTEQSPTRAVMPGDVGDCSVCCAEEGGGQGVRADEEAAVGRDEDAAGGLPVDDRPGPGLGQRADDRRSSARATGGAEAEVATRTEPQVPVAGQVGPVEVERPGCGVGDVGEGEHPVTGSQPCGHRR